MSVRPNRDRPSGSSRGSGFQAQIKGATLADLVQMECLAGSRRVVRVTSENSSGYLYFRGGAVVHATSRSLNGDAAALEMLTWSEGTFEPVEREWPAKENIACSWQSLLLRAAQLTDERQGQSVVAFLPEPRGKAKPSPELMLENVEFDVTPFEIGGHILRSEDFEVILRLSPTGTVVVNQGGTEDFGDMLAYTTRLTELIGEMLGLERFVAMECSFKDSRCFVVRDDTGEIVAVKPNPSADLNGIRELLGV